MDLLAWRQTTWSEPLIEADADPRVGGKIREEGSGELPPLPPNLPLAEKNRKSPRPAAADQISGEVSATVGTLPSFPCPCSHHDVVVTCEEVTAGGEGGQL